METTKTFKAWNGEKELTREEFIEEWIHPTQERYGYLFAQFGAHEKLEAFLFQIEELAGKAWDKH